MTAVTTLPFGRPLTRADLDAMPDDGHRYELIDGVLVVSPSSPGLRHQDLVAGLHLALRAACPRSLRVVLGPFDLVLADDTVLVHDLMVAPRSQFTERDLPGPPLLAIEVLSPSTRRFDLLVKRDRLEAAGAASYWIVDPAGPTIQVLELSGGTYVEVAQATADEAVEVSLPFPLRIVPKDLLDD